MIINWIEVFEDSIAERCNLIYEMLAGKKENKVSNLYEDKGLPMEDRLRDQAFWESKGLDGIRIRRTEVASKKSINDLEEDLKFYLSKVTETREKIAEERVREKEESNSNQGSTDKT